MFSYHKADSFFNLMSLVAHALICSCSEVGIMIFEYYLIFVMIFLCSLFTEKINFLLVKQDDFDQ